MSKDSAAPERTRDIVPATDSRNTLPVVITIAVLGIMAVVIAVDALSVPGLAIGALFTLGVVIACIAIFG